MSKTVTIDLAEYETLLTFRIQSERLTSIMRKTTRSLENIQGHIEAEEIALSKIRQALRSYINPEYALHEITEIMNELDNQKENR